MKCRVETKTAICVGCEHATEHEYVDDCSHKCAAHYENCKCKRTVVKK